MDTIRKLYYFVDPLQRLSALGEQKRQIDRDQIRTAFEKKTELERLSQQKQAMYNTVRTALQNDWGVLKSQYQQLRCEKTAAADRSARRWEYPRLEYARKDARQFLQSASLPAVMRRYKEIELSGDTHALRGFVEDAINVIGNERKFSEQDSIRVTDMRTEFEKMYNDLTITPEMRDLAKQGETLTGKVRGCMRRPTAPSASLSRLTQWVHLTTHLTK